LVRRKGGGGLNSILLETLSLIRIVSPYVFLVLITVMVILLIAAMRLRKVAAELGLDTSGRLEEMKKMRAELAVLRSRKKENSAIAAQTLQELETFNNNLGELNLTTEQLATLAALRNRGEELKQTELELERRLKETEVNVYKLYRDTSIVHYILRLFGGTSLS
jgi:hypothetical protein